MKIKRSVLSALLIIFSCYAPSQQYNNKEISIGNSIKSVCKAHSKTLSKREDPCHGNVQYFEEKKLIMLWNANETLFLVFSNIPSSAFNRRGRLNIKKVGNNSNLLLITSSGNEAIFFIENLFD